MKYFTLFFLLQLTACTISNRLESLRFERQSFEKTVQGICKRPSRVILGLEFDYNIASLEANKDSIYGQLRYTYEKLNPKTGKTEILPYDRVLYIYEIDTANCHYQYLGKTLETGNFAARIKKSTEAIGFSYYELNRDNFNVVDAIIIHRQKKLNN